MRKLHTKRRLLIGGNMALMLSVAVAASVEENGKRNENGIRHVLNVGEGMCNVPVINHSGVSHFLL